MAALLEFKKEELKSKINSIERAVHMYHMRAASYREEREKMCGQARENEVANITAEFNKIIQSLQIKQQQLIQQIDNSFQIVLERDVCTLESGRSEGVISSLLSSKDRVESLLSAETLKRNFFNESAQIGQLIEQDLNILTQIQFEQFEESSDAIEFPTFLLDTDTCKTSIQEVILVESAPEHFPISSSEAEDTPSVLLLEQPIDMLPDQTVAPDLPELTKVTLTESTDDTCLHDELAISSPANPPETPGETADAAACEPTSCEDISSVLISKEMRTVPFERLCVDQKYKFVVTYVKSPSYLYLQLLTKEFNLKIPGITQYHAHIDDNPNEALPVNPDSVTPGSYFFAKYDIDNCWYRAVILGTDTEQQKLNVYFIDYGNPGLVSIDNIRALPEQFFNYPQQAFVASLYNIKPIGSDVTVITPSNDDEWTLPTMKYQWEQEVTQWVDVMLDPHPTVYGYISQCGESNHLELDLVLSTETVRHVLDSNLIPFTPSQLTLLDRDHVSLRELLISGAMGVETDTSTRLVYSDTLSFSTTISSARESATPTHATHPDFSEVFGTLRSHNEEEYYFPNIFQDNGSFSCMVAATDCPDLFYVNISHLRAGVIDEIASEIVSYMETVSFDRNPIDVKQPCLAFYTEDKHWYRGIVLERKNSNQNFFVFFVEFGSTSWVTKEHILPIDRKLLRFPVQAVPCRLYGIKPKNKLLWSLEAVEAFTKLSGPTSILTAFMMSWEVHERIHNNVVIMKEFVINIRLYECDNQKTSLNERLVELEYAEAIDLTRELDLSASSVSFSNSPDELDNWNPMENDFLSPRNNYQYEDDNIDTAIQGYKEPDQSDICRYYNSVRGCKRGGSCKYVHTSYSSRSKARKREIPNSTAVQELPSISSFIHCKIMSIQSAYNFYITCPYGCVDLAGDILSRSGNLSGFFEEKYPIEETEFFLLNKEIQEYYDTQAYPVPSEYYANGEIIIVHSNAHSWSRSRVVNAETFQVFYLDYGYTEVVDPNEIRQIEKKFLFTPFQAIPCILSGIVPVVEKVDLARERLETLARHRNFLARVEGRLEKGKLKMYFLPNANEPMDCNQSCGCLNDLLCDEGLYERCERQNENEIQIFPG